MNYTNGNIGILEKDIEYTSSGKFKKQNCRIKIPKEKQIRIYH